MNDTVVLYSLAPWLILLAILVYGAIHSFLASIWVKAIAQRWFGGVARRGYRLAYNIFALVSLMPVLALPLILPDQEIYTIPYPWVLLTMAIQGLAILALLFGLLQTGPWIFLGLRQLSQPEKDGNEELVISGLYRYVRHPLYTAGLIVIWLTPIMTRNSLVLIIGLSGYIFIGATFEEKRLVREFGEAYLRYRENTPMLIPRPFKKTA
jgi:protein-S-isoprenylcysteine O-methyltransferase Ste14